MKTAQEETVYFDEADAVIDIVAEVNEKEEDVYNQLIFTIYQRTNGTLSHELRIPIVTKKEVLELATKIKKLAKHFPVEI